MSKPRIAIIDYGMGNRRSVEKALEKVGGAAVITSDAKEIEQAQGAVLPGVGAFPEGMRQLRGTGLGSVVCACAKSGKPLLGICLGMQLLFAGSNEFEETAGLGLLSGEVKLLDTQEKLPHIGWNLISWTRSTRLTEGLGENAAFYHVHSFAADAREEDIVGTGEYGTEFVSAVERDNVMGVQFHPEKSGVMGLRLLTNFVQVCGDQ